MRIIETAMLPRALRVRWADDTSAEYPYLWLRDNCPSGFHPQTRERQLDLLSVDEDVRPARVGADGDALTVDWAGTPEHRSRFEAAWLAAHRPGAPAADPADVPAESWGGDFAIPRFPAADLLASDEALLAWLVDAKRRGLGIVTGLAAEPAAGIAVGPRSSPAWAGAPAAATATASSSSGGAASTSPTASSTTTPSRRWCATRAPASSGRSRASRRSGWSASAW